MFRNVVALWFLAFSLMFFSGAASAGSYFKLQCDYGEVSSFKYDPETLDETHYYMVYFYGGEVQKILEPPAPKDAGKIYRFDSDIGDWKKKGSYVRITPGSIVHNHSKYINSEKTLKISRRTGEYEYRKNSWSPKYKGKCKPIYKDPVAKEALF
ncbi:hypothetical protein [Marinobacter sp.]|uniref:hypothetical protein n=1 Tax=Marinobacter sp. TaxID=50741 RepID=UPI002B26FD73|nr:hypothetical protein [Marinobacter sp.]